MLHASSPYPVGLMDGLIVIDPGSCVECPKLAASCRLCQAQVDPLGTSLLPEADVRFRLDAAFWTEEDHPGPEIGIEALKPMIHMCGNEKQMARTWSARRHVPEPEAIILSDACPKKT